MYSYDEVFKKTTEYFNGDELAAKAWADKYALRNLDDEILELTPDDMHKRLAKEFARIEKNKFKQPLSEEEIYQAFKNFGRIIPQGSPMYTIGNPYQFTTVSNCYVLPSPLDSYAGIMYLDSQIVAISSRRGGVGWDVSNLRPKGLSVKNAAKSTSGAISFMKRFSNTIREVAQFGRRGASLQSISVHHPDILEFINVKKDLKEVTGSNITIQFTDEFMNALIRNEEYEQRWPLVNPTITKKVKAKEIWDEFIKASHQMAEPGACFIDTVHRESTSACHGHLEISSNPCGEQYLPAYACCRLIVILLYAYVIDPFLPTARFDWDRFKADVKLMQRLADDMVDLDIEKVDLIIEKIKSDDEPEYIKQITLDLWQKIKETSIQDRRTGCGLTALGDCIAALNMKYGSDESLDFVAEMQREFRDAAYESSVDMAEELGPFPCYTAENDIKSAFIQRLKEENPSLYERMIKIGRRNMTILTIAPTGTVSCLTRTTSGLEPLFLIFYLRRKKGNPGDKNFRTDFVDDNGDHWMVFEVYHSKVQEWMNATGLSDIEQSPYFGACANDIDWLQRVKLQAILNKYVDNSISSTLNLPKDISMEKVSEIYLEAWLLGCKGLTIYRDGCRDGVLIATNETKNKDSIKRPKELPAIAYHVNVRGDTYFVVVGMLNGQPYEVIAGKDVCSTLNRKIKDCVVKRVKRGHYQLRLGDEVICDDLTEKCEPEEEALTRMISTGLRHGVDIKYIAEQLEKSKGSLINFSKALSRTLRRYIPDGAQVSGDECPQCGSSLQHAEGCISCASNCGWSKCS